MTYAATTWSFKLMPEKWKLVAWEQPGEWDAADPVLSGAAHSYTR